MGNQLLFGIFDDILVLCGGFCGFGDELIIRYPEDYHCQLSSKMRELIGQFVAAWPFRIFRILIILRRTRKHVETY